LRGAEAAFAGHFQIRKGGRIEVPIGFRYVGVERERIGAGHKSFLQQHVVKVAPGRSVAEKHGYESINVSVGRTKSARSRLS
jgi:hypothetical protein